jgi:hypothetical protein
VLCCTDSATDCILSKQQQDAPLTLSSYCIKFSPLPGLITDTPAINHRYQVSWSGEFCRSLGPYFPHYNHDGVHRNGTRRLNSSPQQFNLTKCPFIMCVVGLQHTSRLNTAALAHLVREHKQGHSTSSSGLVITSNS